MAAMQADTEAVQTGASIAAATPADARFEAFAQALDTCVETEEHAADQRAEGAEDPDTDERRARDIAEVHRALMAWATKGTGSATVSAEQPRGTLSAFMYKKQDDAYMRIEAQVDPKDRGCLPDNEDLVAGFIHAFGFAVPGEEDGAEELSSIQRMRLEDALEAYFEAMKANCPEDDNEDGEESSDDEGGFNWAPPEIPGLIDLEEFRQRMMGPKTVREILGIEAGDKGDNDETSDTIETGEAGEIGGKASDSA